MVEQLNYSIGQLFKVNQAHAAVGFSVPALKVGLLAFRDAQVPIQYCTAVYRVWIID